jgi:hypothetical protein
MEKWDPFSLRERINKLPKKVKDLPRHIEIK